MSAMPEQERVRRLTDRREPDSVKIARIEEVVGGIREDVSEIKATLGSFEHRISYVEDVRVRGLEEREIRQNAIASERARAADAAQAAAEKAAADARAQKKHQLSRRDVWLTAVLLWAGTILSALIASGRLF